MMNIIIDGITYAVNWLKGGKNQQNLIKTIKKELKKI